MRPANPSQLEQVRDIARARERELALEVAELSRRLEAEEATFARLGAYLEEYSREPARGACRPHEIHNHRRFVERLDRALRQQQLQVDRALERARAATGRWHHARAELEALTRVIERRALEEQRLRERREQREADARPAAPRPHAAEVFP